jgi:hypothetical protein
MQQTFELYLRSGDGPERFHVVTCLPEDVVRRAQEVLDRSEGDEVDVRLMGDHLFTLVR